MSKENLKSNYQTHRSGAREKMSYVIPTIKMSKEFKKWLYQTHNSVARKKTNQKHLRWSFLRKQHPLDWNSPCRGEGASHQEVSNRVRQREELNWTSQLKSSDQQIFSRMSDTDSLFG